MDENGQVPPPKKWSRRIGVWTSLLIAMVLAAIAALSATGSGQRVVQARVLTQIRGSLAGDLDIEGMRSGTLLTGATLTGVVLRAEGGRRFLEADSIQIRYSPLALITGQPRLTSLIAWGLDVEISRLPSEASLNIRRVLADAVDTPLGEGEAEPLAPFVVGHFAVRGGLVQILYPASAETTGPTVPSPDGNGRLRRLAFEEIDLDLEDLTLRLGDANRILDAQLASLSMQNSITSEPFTLDEAFGGFEFGARGIRITDAAFRFPASLLRGELTVGPASDGEPWGFFARLETDGLADLRDLSWIDDRIPAGSFQGAASISVAGGTRVDLDQIEIELEASSVMLDGRVMFTDSMRFEDLDVTASPLALERIEPWLGREMPVEGWLSGEARFNGTLTDLQASGRVTLVPIGYGGQPTSADFSGTLHGGENPGATALEVRLNPVNYRLVEVLGRDLPMSGTGTVDVSLSGRATDGIRLVVDASHEADSVPRSRVILRGAVRRTETGDWIADVQGDVTPLSLRAFANIRPDLALAGEVTGAIRGIGRLRDLTVSADLDAEGGRIGLSGVVDLQRPGSFYRVDAVAEEVPLSRFLTRLPEGSEWSGSLSIEGRGIRLDSMDATATLVWSQSRIGDLRVDTVMAHLSASAGILTADSLDARLGGFVVSGSGRLGMAAPLDGAARLTFATDDLGGLRPLFLGDTVIAKDTLSSLEETVLRFDGVDVDALPDTADVRMHGAITGTVRLVGSVDALDVDLEMDVRGAVYGHNRVDSARVVLSADALPGLTGDWDIVADAFGVAWQGRSFEAARIDGAMSARRGDVVVSIQRQPGEQVAASGRFDFDSLGGRVDVTTASATIDSLEYSLAQPTRIAWGSGTLTVGNTEIVRAGGDPMRVTALGTLSRSGDSHFDIEVDGLHVERLTQLLEVEVVAEGHADLTLSVRGPAADPSITVHLEVLEPRYGGLSFSRVTASLDYVGREATVQLDALDADRLVFGASGSVPVDLSLEDRETRFVRAPMDLTLSADSLDAAVALSFFETLEDVVGYVTGRVRIRGTTESPEPNGVVALEGAAWSLEALGVRHSDVNGSLTFNPDRRLAVHLVSEANGRVELDGAVTLDPVRDPKLDLELNFSSFQAVQRVDIESLISGEITVDGRYGRPEIRGTVTVDEATLFVDEFVRSASVIDLSDPTTFGADTTEFFTQPLIRDIRNPFLENLRVEVDLAVPRNTWLRSDDMAVEMGGAQLIVTYDRRLGDLVLVGELEALRGSYSVLGRNFEVTGGTMGFMGTPGINPILDIQAVSRIRRRDAGNDLLNVNANVEGTLAIPRVALSTDEAGLVQSELFSYLIFGRSSSELATGQEAFLQGAVAGAATTLVTGAVATQLGALAQRAGVDYLSITQAGDFVLASGLTSQLASTQVEIGQYIGPDAFIVLVFRPLSGQDTAGSFFGGARLEWAFSDDFTVEGFVEDRFLRTGSAGFGGLGLPQSKIVGLFIFREWGYR